MSAHHQLSEAIRSAVNAAHADSLLSVAAPETITLERPKNRDHGDYATSIALVLAKAAGKPPREIAEIVVKALSGNPTIEKLEIAGPGFINITLAKASQGAVVSSILNQKEKFGLGTSLKGIKINLEFISANPTGPLHLGHTRWAAVGDALGRTLTAAGAEVTREFYVNDRGVQMDLFGESIRASALGIARPESGYQGAYIDDLAGQIKSEHPDFVTLPEKESIVAFREAGYALQLKQQQDVLERFGTHFDVWFSERSMHEKDAIAKAMKQLKAQGHV